MRFEGRGRVVYNGVVLCEGVPFSVQVAADDLAEGVLRELSRNSVGPLEVTMSGQAVGFVAEFTYGCGMGRLAKEYGLARPRLRLEVVDPKDPA